MANGQQRGFSNYPHYDRRYRNSSYFLEDQLRCSEAIADYKSVKNVVNKLAEIEAHDMLQYAPITIRIREE